MQLSFLFRLGKSSGPLNKKSMIGCYLNESVSMRPGRKFQQVEKCP